MSGGPVAQVFVGKLPGVPVDFGLIKKSDPSIPQDVVDCLVAYAKCQTVPLFKSDAVARGCLPGRIGKFVRTFFQRIPIIDHARRPDFFYHFVLLQPEIWFSLGECAAFAFTSDEIFLKKENLGANPQFRWGDWIRSPKKLGEVDKRFAVYKALVRKFTKKLHGLTRSVAETLNGEPELLRVGTTTASGYELAAASLLLSDVSKRDDFWFTAIGTTGRVAGEFGFANDWRALISDHKGSSTAVQLDEPSSPTASRLTSQKQLQASLTGNVDETTEVRQNTVETSPSCPIERILKEPLKLILVGYTGSGKTSFLLSLSNFAQLIPYAGLFIEPHGPSKQFLKTLERDYNDTGKTQGTIGDPLRPDDLFSSMDLTHTFHDISHKIHIADYRGGQLGEADGTSHEFVQLRHEYRHADGVIVLYDARWLLRKNDSTVKGVYQNFATDFSRAEKSKIPTALVLTHADCVIPEITGIRLVDMSVTALRNLPTTLWRIASQWPVLSLLSGVTALFYGMFTSSGILGALAVVFLLTHFPWTILRFRSIAAVDYGPKKWPAELLLFPLRLIRLSCYLEPNEVAEEVRANCREAIGLHITSGRPEHQIFAISFPTSPKATVNADYEPFKYSLFRSRGVTNPFDHIFFWGVAKRLRRVYAAGHDVEGSTSESRTILQAIVTRFQEGVSVFRRFGCRNEEDLSRFDIDVAVERIEGDQKLFAEREQYVAEWEAEGKAILDQIELANTSIEHSWDVVNDHLTEAFSRTLDVAEPFDDLSSRLWASQNQFVQRICRYSIRQRFGTTLSAIAVEMREHGVKPQMLTHLAGSIRDVQRSTLDVLTGTLRDKPAKDRLFASIITDYKKGLHKSLALLCSASGVVSSFDKSVTLGDLFQFLAVIERLPHEFSIFGTDVGDAAEFESVTSAISRNLLNSYLNETYLRDVAKLGSGQASKRIDIEFSIPKISRFLDGTSSLLNRLQRDFDNARGYADGPALDMRLAVIREFSDGRLRNELQEQLEPLGRALQGVVSTCAGGNSHNRCN